MEIALCSEDQLIVFDCVVIGPREVDESPFEISSSFHDIETIESKLQEHVDKSHPIVQELISADYPEERSILAVRKFGTLDAAMKYLDQSNEGDGEKDCKGSPSKANNMLEDDKMHE